MNAIKHKGNRLTCLQGLSSILTEKKKKNGYNFRDDDSDGRKLCERHLRRCQEAIISGPPADTDLT